MNILLHNQLRQPEFNECTGHVKSLLQLESHLPRLGHSAVNYEYQRWTCFSHLFTFNTSISLQSRQSRRTLREKHQKSEDCRLSFKTVMNSFTEEYHVCTIGPGGPSGPVAPGSPCSPYIRIKHIHLLTQNCCLRQNCIWGLCYILVVKRVIFTIILISTKENYILL